MSRSAQAWETFKALLLALACLAAFAALTWAAGQVPSPSRDDDPPARDGEWTYQCGGGRVGEC